MTRNEVGLALDWAAIEGWNPGLFDAEAFFAVDPEGFFLAERDGISVGSFACVRYDDHFGFAGLLIVDPRLRGQRYGVELGRVGIEHLGSRVIGLDGVLRKERHYRRFGFAPQYRTIRYAFPTWEHLDEAPSMQHEVISLRDYSIEDLTAYDATLFPSPRPSFLTHWVHLPGHTAIGILVRDRLAGYGIIRPCREGYKIGPLFADNPQIAQAIFTGLTATAPGSTVYLDIPEPNRIAMDFACQMRMKPVFYTVRMLRGQPPKTDLNRVFGVTTLELG
jgi:hypothetical protein